MQQTGLRQGNILNLFSTLLKQGIALQLITMEIYGHLFELPTLPEQGITLQRSVSSTRIIAAHTFNPAEAGNNIATGSTVYCQPTYLLLSALLKQGITLQLKNQRDLIEEALLPTLLKQGIPLQP